MDNSCLTCAVASDRDRCNGYIDLKCNIGYRLGWDKVPFLQREKEVEAYSRNRLEIESKYPCKYHMTLEQYVEMIDEVI